MAGRRRAVPVLLVDTSYHLKGIRRSAKRSMLPGGVQVISADSGYACVPEDIEPTAIHVHVAGFGARAELLQDFADILMERAGMTEHAHYALETLPRDRDLTQQCRCGARRERPRGPHPWTEWT